MPIYEYKCSKCDEEFETLVFKSDESVACPQCKGENVKRLMSACEFKSSGALHPLQDHLIVQAVQAPTVALAIRF